MIGTVAQSGNVPTMYNPICCFDASDTSPSNITQASGFVSLWKNRAGTGYDFFQNSSGGQPQTGTITINSLNGFNFDMADFMSLGNVPATPDLTIMAVFKPLGNNDGTASFLSANAANNDFQIDAVFANQFRGRINTTGLGATSNPAFGTNQRNNIIQATYRFSANESNVKVRLNGTQTGLGTYNGLMSSTLLYKIATNRVQNRSQLMHLGELLIFNDDLNNTQMDTIETYLMDKWGIA